MNTPTPDPNNNPLEGTRTNPSSSAPPEETVTAPQGFSGAIYAPRFPESLTNGARLRDAIDSIKETERSLAETAKSVNDVELRRKGAACVYVPRQGFFSRLSIWLQSLLWLFGIYWHNAYRDECCPDFGCCSTCSTPFKERWNFIKRQLLGFKKG